MNLFNDLIRFKNSKEWIEFEKYYDRTSILEMIDFFRFEDVNTNFLASLLRETNPYNLGSYPLHLLCGLIACKDEENKLPFVKDICMFSGDLSNINVRTQVNLPSGRIDLLITFDTEANEQYLIALEAKLDSYEHDDQCNNYRLDIESLEEYNSYKKVYLYLSLSNKDHISDEENYLKITYQDLIDYVYEPCSYKSDDNSLSFTINEYINGFSSLYGKEKSIEYIPITHEGERLTRAVWDKDKVIIKNFLDNAVTNLFAEAFFKNNQRLLKIFFVNITKMKDLNIEDEYIGTFDIINRIAQNIRERNKLNNCYYTDSEFIYQVFKDIISKVKITDYKQLNKINEHKFIYSPEEYEEAKTKSYHTIDKYGKLSIPENSDNYYYYSINNTPEEILNLIELIKTNFSEYYNHLNLKRLENINQLVKNKT